MTRVQRHRVRFDAQRHVVEFGGPGDVVAIDPRETWSDSDVTWSDPGFTWNGSST